MRPSTLLLSTLSMAIALPTPDLNELGAGAIGNPLAGGFTPDLPSLPDLPLADSFTGLTKGLDLDLPVAGNAANLPGNPTDIFA